MEIVWCQSKADDLVFWFYGDMNFIEWTHLASAGENESARKGICGRRIPYLKHTTFGSNSFSFGLHLCICVRACARGWTGHTIRLCSAIYIYIILLWHICKGFSVFFCLRQNIMMKETSKHTLTHTETDTAYFETEHKWIEKPRFWIGVCCAVCTIVYHTRVCVTRTGEKSKNLKQFYTMIGTYVRLAYPSELRCKTIFSCFAFNHSFSN